LAVSIGAAIFPHDGDSYEALLATADSRMYRDKSRRKQQARAQSGVNGADGRTTTLMTTSSIEPTEIEIERAGRGVL
jgi:predicted signal transduction protein with EAL and GGDEF domain